MPRTIIERVDWPNGNLNLAESTIQCEAPGCTNPVKPGRSYSFHFRVAYATTGPTGAIPSFVCPEEQHFGCSPEHAEAAAADCMHNHLIPLHAQKTAEYAAEHPTPVVVPVLSASPTDADYIADAIERGQPHAEPIEPAPAETPAETPIAAPQEGEQLS